MKAIESEASGVLIINKPQSFTSHDVVNKLRRLYGTRRVGHTGTLDPMATGVLVVLIGRAAKAAEYLSSDKKGYRATLRLGITTDTEDTTGNVLSSTSTLPSPDAVSNACKKFEGTILQIPPMYSALKVGGKKLCDLARRGVTVERQAREITIHSLQVEPTDTESDYILDVKCSSGTYIRTLCADIGQMLGCGGAMATLCRTAAGEFSIENSHTLEEIEALGTEERNSLLLPTESLFYDLEAIKLPAFYEKLCRSGCEIYLSKIKASFPLGTRVRLCGENGVFFALGEVGEYENGIAVKSIKLFEI